MEADVVPTEIVDEKEDDVWWSRGEAVWQEEEEEEEEEHVENCVLCAACGVPDR